MSVRKFSTNSLISPIFKNSRVWDQSSYPSFFDSIASITAPGGSGTSVTFNNIPQNYSSLRLHVVAATHDNNVRSLQMVLNDDIGTVYSAHGFYQSNGTMNYTNNTSQQGALFFSTSVPSGGLGAAATYWSSFIIDIYDYTNTTKNKTLSGFGGYGGDGTNGAFGFGSSLYMSLNPITKIQLQPTYASGFRAGSTFCLYGMK